MDQTTIGFPDGSPATSPYFSQPEHKQDRYSIAFRLLPKKPKDASSEGVYKPIDGDSLAFGNDFDHSIKDKLPPGFNTAFKIVKWAIDPGLDGDAYSEKPYLYGPVLSSMNTLSIPAPPGDTIDVEEGEAKEPETQTSDKTKESSPSKKTETSGWSALPKWTDEPFTESLPTTVLPAGTTPSTRRKHFLTQANRTKFHFEPDQVYECDFFNPYLDFNEFALRLPGFSIHILKFLSSNQLEEDHTLRYVLKSRDEEGKIGGEGVGKVWFVVCLTLVLSKEDLLPGATKDEDAVGVGAGEKEGEDEKLAKDLNQKAKIKDPVDDDEGVD